MEPIDAIILDLDGGAMLDALLESIAAQTRPFRQVIIWDNGSKVPASARIAHPSLPLRIHRSDTNLGFSGGINHAMYLTDAPLVAWINSDVRLEPEWTARLLEVVADGGVAAAQAINVTDDGVVDGAGINIDDGTYRQEGRGLSVGEVAERAREPWGISATAALYRARALRDVAYGPFVLHPDFVLYYEDVELSARLRAGGWRLELVRAPLAHHGGSKSARLEPRADRMRVRNRYWVHRLHPGVGRRSALVTEDVGRIARAALRLRFGEAALIGKAMREGMRAPLSPEGRFVT
jgi:GT2 family glycosyltransferase